MKYRALYMSLVLVTICLLNGCKQSQDEYVYQNCVTRIKEKLKAPRTAIFSTKEETYIYLKKKTYPNDGVLRGTWTVEGFVDSQNSYGALIRSSFKCNYEQWKDETTFLRASL